VVLSAERYQAYQAEVAALGDIRLDDTRFSDLTSVPQVIAYYFKTLKDAGHDDEAVLDQIEIFVRHNGLTAHETRACSKVLKRLGFTLLATRLSWLAARRMSTLRPLVG
jgi:hypothetical protein